MERPRIAVIVGPTATGKSSLACALAQQFSGEIISADSVQVYRGMDIGTAKPSKEERRLIPHHLIDFLDPDQDYSAAMFREQADAIIHTLQNRKTAVFVVGGTGLYVKVLTRGLFVGPAGDPLLRKRLHRKADEEGIGSLHKELQELDPEAALRIHPQDKLRIIRALEVYALRGKPISEFQKKHAFKEAPYEVLKIGLEMARGELYRRIERRTEEMMERGWVEEVQSLLRKGYRPELKALQSLGYRQILSHLGGKISIEETIRMIKRDTRRYAKRQVTWFKADPEIHWFPAHQECFRAVSSTVAGFLRSEYYNANRMNP